MLQYQSMENLKITPTSSASASGIPNSASQASVHAQLCFIICRNSALRGSKLRLMFLTEEYGLLGHRSAVPFWKHTLLCVIFFFIKSEKQLHLYS